MPFDDDIFVSYAHIDDEVMAGDEGWIEGLHRCLALRLGQLLGKKARIWRDPKLTGNDVFGDELVARLPRVATVVSVVSPRYVKSEWCQRELDTFIEATGGARVGNKLRVFKVVKTPVPRDQQPESLRPALGYEFFTVDPQSGRSRELVLNEQISSPEEMRLYSLKIDDLARDVADLLPRLEGEEALPDTEVRGYVYLAETSSDLRDDRDVLRRELQANGYAVLPDAPLPLIDEECRAFVSEQLSRCSLSVHMIGSHYGIVPENSVESTIEVQNELSVERADQGGFYRLIWMPPDVEADDDRQRDFLERLQSDPRHDATTDLLKTPIADFITVLHKRLTPPPARDPSPDTATGIKHIYLICDQRDFEQVRPLEDLLFESEFEFEVTLPVFEGDEAQVRREHEASLTECDAALVYYGAGNELWLRSKLREMQKIAGKGRTKPMLAKGVYVAGPETPAKARYRTREAVVIAGGEAPTIESLAPFLDKLG